MYLVFFDAPVVAQFRQQLGLDAGGEVTDPVRCGRRLRFQPMASAASRRRGRMPGGGGRADMMELYDIPVTTIDGADHHARALPRQGASHRQCRQPLRLHSAVSRSRSAVPKLQDRLVVLGFPCNQFGRQEPGNEADIRTFCSELRRDFSAVREDRRQWAGAHPLYRYLKSRRRDCWGAIRLRGTSPSSLWAGTAKCFGDTALDAAPGDIEKDLDALV